MNIFFLENNLSHSQSPIEDESNTDSIDDDDDLHDLPSDFDNDDLFNESDDTNGDMEFLRNATKNLMSTLSEMEAASSDTDIINAPHSLLYGDDYIVTIRNRRFALAFLDYTQFRVEKQRNPDKYRLLGQLRKLKVKKKSLENSQLIDPTKINEMKLNKKKRNKRNKKKKNTNEDTQLINE